MEHHEPPAPRAMAVEIDQRPVLIDQLDIREPLSDQWAHGIEVDFGQTERWIVGQGHAGSMPSTQYSRVSVSMSSCVTF